MRNRGARAFRARALVLGVGILVLALVACAGSAPVRSIRAARYYAAGTRDLERGETRSAIEALELAVGLMPNASEIHNHLGLAYWSDGREDAALRELERAIELDCENEAARSNLDRLRAEMSVEGREAGSGADRSGWPALRDGVERSAVHGG